MPKVVVSGCVLAAVTLASLSGRTAAQAPPTPAAQLVRLAVQNEIKSADTRYTFREYRKTGRGTETRVVVETPEARAAVLVAIDGKPLTPEQQRNELSEAERLGMNREELRKHQKDEREEAERVNRIVRALPAAFLYEYGASGAAASGAEARGQVVRLNFVPKPGYDSPSRVEEVLTGMKGQLLIDTRANRIAKIDGTLMKNVGFGWGILGHLNLGGHFKLDRAEVGPNDWRTIHLDLAFTGKVLLFKKLNIRTDEEYRDFRPVPADLTFARGVELLRQPSAARIPN